MPKIDDAQVMLKTLGLPTGQQNEISALTLLALVGVGPNDAWAAARRWRLGVSNGIMVFIAERYGKQYKPNTRETIRRQVLHQFMQAHMADYNPFEPDLATNSPRAHYAVTEAALAAIRTFGSAGWDGAAAQFIAEYGSLATRYARHRSRGTLVPITLPDGRTIELSPGRHNQVQKAVVEQFAPRFAPKAALLYLGDTANKSLVMDSEALDRFGMPVSQHDKLPDVIFFDLEHERLFLVEAVTSHGPMTSKRVFELNEWLKPGTVDPVYVSAFPSMSEFRKYITEIAWETEIWIADIPDHMIHFNGEQFLGPRTSQDSS